MKGLTPSNEIRCRVASLSCFPFVFPCLRPQGLTIISTAGDLGVSDGVLCASEFYADFPSSSPYTTSLGATSVSRFSTDTSPVCAGTYTAYVHGSFVLFNFPFHVWC